MIATLPKYVLVGGGPQLLISSDPGNPTVPRGTYMPIALPGGHVRLECLRTHATFTVHKDVWPVAVADFRIGAA